MQTARWYLLCALTIIVGALWYAVLVEEPNERVLRVAFLSVGQGDATLITAPNGVQVLIDGGPGARVIRELGREMLWYDRSIDVVIATHPDLDHIGGLPEVLERYDVDMVLRSGVPNDNGVQDALLRYIEVEGAQEVLARRGQRLVLDDQTGVYLDILFPDRDVSQVSDVNDGSIALRLVYGDTEFLFTGDLHKDTEEYLVWLASESVKADVVQVGHHGSKTSTSDYFIGWVEPEYAVISAGCDNRYGHPHASVIETLQKFEIEILEICREGRVVFESDGTTLTKK